MEILIRRRSFFVAQIALTAFLVCAAGARRAWSQTNRARAAESNALQSLLQISQLSVPSVEIPGSRPASGPGYYSPGVMGLIQYDADAAFGDYEHNRARLTVLALQAVQRGSKIIVMPEGSSYGYVGTDELWCKPGMTEFKTKTWTKRCRDVSTVAESVPGGPSARYWGEFSRRHGVYVAFSVPEQDGDRFYNTLGVTGPDGYVTKYRKRILYVTDKAYATPGDGPVVLETPYGRFGLMICLDADPAAGLFREYRTLDVSAVIISMDWDDDPNGEYAASAKFRQWAREHRMDVYASDATPWDGTARYRTDGEARDRAGLPAQAVGLEGVSVHDFQYSR
jgi:predicted amidohydrolase